MSVMQMLFDQDYIWDVHVKSEVRQAREEEREKAARVLNEEREKAEKREKAAVSNAVDNGIVITIESLRDYGIPEAEIMRKIMEKHGLDRQAAERYMNMSLVD